MPANIYDWWLLLRSSATTAKAFLGAYKSVGYFFIQDVGMFPYYSRHGVHVEHDHILLGYLQCEESLLDLDAAVWYYFKDTEYLDPSSSTMESLMFF
ncbi:hypothetical protein K443DRAFT_4251 [Laccaria amethystina LaAM-08-1]|uniref:Uncharacterized protein n=1 Tax=Laccaria amethystina LaAM-08-1 TaxID=1095629 RepID=A0A0C9YA44_9AGAR|nr:hypothetical protein K443DRAFT_4251 [Laccaria amethystina LaAM-08-1]